MSEENYNDKREKLIQIANQSGNAPLNELDDFEREALEGLRLIEKKDAQVFSKMDQRIDKVLLDKKSRKKSFLIWSVAASVVMVIGISLVFKNSWGNGENIRQITIAENSIRKDSVSLPEPTNTVQQSTAANEKNTIVEVQGSDKKVKEKEVREEDVAYDNLVEANIQQTEVVNPNSTSIDVEEKKYESSNADNTNQNVVSPSMASAGAPSVTVDAEMETRKRVTDKKTNEFREIEKQKNRAADLGRSEGFDVSDSTFGEVQILASSPTNPIYPGGNSALNTFFKSNFKVQNMSLLMGNTIQISVYVNDKGKVSKYKILHSIPNCSDCSKEAIRVCGLLADWIPGTEKGKPEGKRVTFSIAF